MQSSISMNFLWPDPSRTLIYTTISRFFLQKWRNFKDISFLKLFKNIIFWISVENWIIKWYLIRFKAKKSLKNLVQYNGWSKNCRTRLKFILPPVLHTLCFWFFYTKYTHYRPTKWYNQNIENDSLSIYFIKFARSPIFYLWAKFMLIICSLLTNYFFPIVTLLILLNV